MSKSKSKPESDLPIIESIALYNLPDEGNNGWVVLTIYTQGDKVIKVVSSEANLREITIEMAKIQFVKSFMDVSE
jgi:hypothetical protein